MTDITTRADKGAPLTHDELDQNFLNLQETADLAYAASAGLGGKANAAALGTDDAATDLGAFTSDLITDGATAKGALQELATAIETTSGSAATKVNATAVGVAPTDANMGTTPGTILSDNGTAKAWFQEGEAAIEARVTTAKLASSSSGDGADAVNFTGKTIEPETVNADGDNSFGTGFDKVQAFRGRITLGALSGPMSFGDLQYCGIQNFGRYDIDGNYAAIQHTTDDSCALFGFFKARGTQTSPSAVVVNDDVGELSFHAWDGSTFVKGALITPIVKTVSSGIVSMTMRFWTMDTGGVLRNAVDIDNAKKLWAYGGIDAKWATAGGSAFRAYYDGSSGGGAEIRTSNGFSSTVPVYAFWFNSATGIGNPANNEASVIINGAEKFRFDASGNLFSTGGGLIGYGAGSGGTVTQATDKSTAVTLNTSSGRITMNAAALAAGASVTFTLNNSKITTSDIVMVMQSTGAATWGSYQVWAAGAGSGMVGITVKNVTGGSLSEAIVVNFAIIKGATS